MTGYGISASHLGLPDAGPVVVRRHGSIGPARSQPAPRRPLIADADTGFGGLLNVHHTVQAYEAAGVAAIQLEDQEFPKKCGHADGAAGRADRRTWCARWRSRSTPERATTCWSSPAPMPARPSAWMKPSLALRAYAAAGALTSIFVESPESEDEFARIAQTVDAPLVANMVEGGFSPILTGDRLAELGFTIGLFPVSGLATAAAALTQTYAILRETGTSPGVSDGLLSIADLHQLMGFDDVNAFDQRWAD